MMPKLHTIGRVAGKHGFNGDLVLHFQNENAAKSIQQGDFLFVLIDGKGVPFFIERFNPKNGIVKLADVDNADQASELEGLAALSESEEIETELMPLDLLLNFEVRLIDEQVLGTLFSIEEYPAGPMLIVKNKDSETLIPAVDEWIAHVDEKNKTLYLDLPEGLLEL